jgi:hypothetical protein
MQRGFGDFLAAEMAVFREPIRKLATDHSCCADNENMHLC